MDFLINPMSIAFLLLALVYVLGRKYIEIKEKRIRQISDGEYLSLIALGRKCSE